MPADQYKGKETGDIGFDLYYMSKKSFDGQQFAISEIDRIKKIDVPWKWYVGIFIALMILSGVGSWALSIYVAMPISPLVAIMLIFIIVVGGIFLLITFYGFKEEEIRDCQKLCKFYNEIKFER